MKPPHSVHPDHYFPHYQPLIHLATGQVSGHELLARTRDSLGEVVSAGGLFLDPGLDAKDKIALDRHLRQRAFERFAGDPGTGFLSINISPDWVNRLGASALSPTLQMIERCGMDPHRVVIEITETCGDLERLQRLVKQYHASGIRVAIDDFGAGDSQVDRIIALHPDLIKLDMRLFKDAARGGISADVLLSLMAVAERAGCEVVCEGVETDEEFYFGIECGARYMQGYLFSPATPEPVPADSTIDKVQTLLDTYLRLKTYRLGEAIDRARDIKHRVLDLRRRLTSGSPEQLDTGVLYALGLMRFFICDERGVQLSPNYEITAAGLREEARFQGHNWSWRPYFPTLAAMKHRAHFELVASAAYRDAATGRLCKTFGLYLDEGRILLVDAEVYDEVLYAHN